MTTCAWCGAPRADSLKCPKCKAVYSKAEALRGAEILRSNSAVWNGETDAQALEARLRRFAIPGALLFALALHAGALGRFLMRTFFSMPVHELGHTVAAWLCGIVAVPTLWKTIMFSESRGFAAPLLVAGALLWFIYKDAHQQRTLQVRLGTALLVLQVVCTFLLPLHSALALISFAGDGGAMILAVLLMSSFYARRESQLVVGWLRWGFLVIGASTFVDIFSVWWSARTDPDAIPFGENEGVGLSDASQLSDMHGWSASTLVSRYLLLGAICLVVLGIIYVRGLGEFSRAGSRRADDLDVDQGTNSR